MLLEAKMVVSFSLISRQYWHKKVKVVGKSSLKTTTSIEFVCLFLLGS